MRTYRFYLLFELELTRWKWRIGDPYVLLEQSRKDTATSASRQEERTSCLDHSQHLLAFLQ